MISYKDLLSKDIHHVAETRNRLKKEQFSLRFQLKTVKLSDTSKVRTNRRDLARVMTRLVELKKLKKKG